MVCVPRSSSCRFPLAISCCSPALLLFLMASRIAPPILAPCPAPKPGSSIPSPKGGGTQSPSGPACIITSGGGGEDGTCCAPAIPAQSTRAHPTVTLTVNLRFMLSSPLFSPDLPKKLVLTRACEQPRAIHRSRRASPPESIHWRGLHSRAGQARQVRHAAGEREGWRRHPYRLAKLPATT